MRYWDSLTAISWRWRSMTNSHFLCRFGYSTCFFHVCLHLCCILRVATRFHFWTCLRETKNSALSTTYSQCVYMYLNFNSCAKVNIFASYYICKSWNLSEKLHEKVCCTARRTSCARRTRSKPLASNCRISHSSSRTWRSSSHLKFRYGKNCI